MKLATYSLNGKESWGAVSGDGIVDLARRTKFASVFETLRAGALRRVRFEARRELTQSAVLLLLAVTLFWWHWRWAREAERRATAERAALRETSASG